MQDYRLTKLWILTAVVSAFLIVSATMLFEQIDSAITERSRQKKAENEKQEVQLEVQHRRAERENNGNSIVNTPHIKSAESSDHVDTMPIELTAIAELPKNSSDTSSQVLTSGPYKGMTPEEVQAFEQRERVWIQRVTENNKRRTDAFNLTSQNIENRKALMLSYFKSLSPEQLKYVREGAFERIPAEDVEYFFDNLENKGSKMTDAQLIAEGNRILASSEAEDVILRELEIEHQELMNEHKELQEYIKQKNIQR